MSREYIYVYNLTQAEFYFSKGITPLRVGKGSKGDYFVQFLRTDQLKSAFDEWCRRWKPMA